MIIKSKNTEVTISLGEVLIGVKFIVLLVLFISSRTNKQKTIN